MSLHIVFLTWNKDISARNWKLPLIFPRCVFPRQRPRSWRWWRCPSLERVWEHRVRRRGWGKRLTSTSDWGMYRSTVSWWWSWGRLGPFVCVYTLYKQFIHTLCTHNSCENALLCDVKWNRQQLRLIKENHSVSVGESTLSGTRCLTEVLEISSPEVRLFHQTLSVIIVV